MFVERIDRRCGCSALAQQLLRVVCCGDARCAVFRLLRRCSLFGSTLLYRPRVRTVGIRVLLGWLAVMGLIVLTVTWIVAGLAQDEYSPRRGFIEDLAALDAQQPWIMITGFVLVGVSTVALGVGLAGAVKGRSATVGSILVAFAGVGFIVAGLARRDCYSQLDACADRYEAGDMSWHWQTHQWVGLVAVLALAVAPLVYARAFRGDQSWRDLRAYSIITGVVGLVLLVLLFTSVAESWGGVLQRVMMTLLLLWVAILGARLIRLSRVRPRESAI
jgi:hypothetical membrane protein